jgi:hypothetical protein
MMDMIVDMLGAEDVPYDGLVGVEGKAIWKGQPPFACLVPSVQRPVQFGDEMVGMAVVELAAVKDVDEGAEGPKRIFGNLRDLLLRFSSSFTIIT